MKKLLLAGLAFVVIVGGVFGFVLFRRMLNTSPRRARLGAWFTDPAAQAAWSVPAKSRCGDAPLIFPTAGYIGFVWDDSWRPGHRHQGIDVFGPDLEPGATPVYAAYDGYLTRLPDWKSTVIVRVPDDPLQPGRQIWMYYTHMADKQGSAFISSDFPAGTSEKPVKAGTLLGYQGNYSGSPDNPTGVHLHFSIVLDNGQGSFRNELDIANTLDPSPYLGLALNANTARGALAVCAPALED